MTLRLTEYKLIFKSYADCSGMLLASAKQNGGKPCHVAHMLFDPRGLVTCEPNTKDIPLTGVQRGRLPGSSSGANPEGGNGLWLFIVSGFCWAQSEALWGAGMWAWSQTAWLES